MMIKSSILSFFVSLFSGKKPAPIANSSSATTDFKPRLLLTKSSLSQASNTSDNEPSHFANKLTVTDKSAGHRLGIGSNYSRGFTDSPKFVRKMRMKWISENEQKRVHGTVDENEDSDLLSTYRPSEISTPKPKSLWDAMGSW
jgi:hypothetical protein